MVEFTVYSQSPTFVAAAMGYDRILMMEGQLMVSALSAFSYLSFKHREVYLRVGKPSKLDKAHFVPLDPSAMTLNSQRAHLTLVLARLLMEQNKVVSSLYSHDKLICLFLYDLWFYVYGEKFANEQKNRLALSTPEWNANWSWALKMSSAYRDYVLYRIMLNRHLKAQV